MNSDSETIQYYNCPVCDGRNDLSDTLEIGELLDCLECGSELEVTQISPLQIVESEIEAEDWGQ